MAPPKDSRSSFERRRGSRDRAEGSFVRRESRSREPPKDGRSSFDQRRSRRDGEEGSVMGRSESARARRQQGLHEAKMHDPEVRDEYKRTQSRDRRILERHGKFYDLKKQYADEIENERWRHEREQAVRQLEGRGRTSSRRTSGRMSSDPSDWRAASQPHSSSRQPGSRSTSQSRSTSRQPGASSSQRPGGHASSRQSGGHSYSQSRSSSRQPSSSRHSSSRSSSRYPEGHGVQRRNEGLITPRRHQHISWRAFFGSGVRVPVDD